MKNKQVELIIHSISNQALEQYLVETYNTPITLLKTKISRGLKGIKQPIGKEDLSAIKTKFMVLELAIDTNLKQENKVMKYLNRLHQLNENEIKDILDFISQIKETHQKEINIYDELIYMIVDYTQVCQVYDLILQLRYKSEDRIDIYQQYLPSQIELSRQ